LIGLGDLASEKAAMNHNRLLAAAVLVLAAVGSTSAWAGWGCAYGNNDYRIGGRRWGADTEKLARASALRGCKADNFKGCHIVGCRANVNSKEDADKLWPLPSGAKAVPCGRNAQEKCK